MKPINILVLTLTLAALCGCAGSNGKELVAAPGAPAMKITCEENVQAVKNLNGETPAVLIREMVLSFEGVGADYVDQCLSENLNIECTAAACIVREN